MAHLRIREISKQELEDRIVEKLNNDSDKEVDVLGDKVPQGTALKLLNIDRLNSIVDEEIEKMKVWNLVEEDSGKLYLCYGEFHAWDYFFKVME